MTTLSIDKNKRMPLHEQCAAALKKAIETGQFDAGEFLPPERELSEQFGVNRITLRKGIADLVRKGYLENIPGAGNRVLERTATEAGSRVIGCLMLRMPGLLTMSPYYADVFDGIMEEVALHGCRLVFASIKPDQLWAPDNRLRIKPNVLKEHYSGVLLLGGLPEELAVAYQKKGLRVTLVDRAATIRGISGVVPDNRFGAIEATRYLLELGHRHMAFIGKAVPDPASEVRFQGFLQTIRDANIEFRKSDLVAASYETNVAQETVKKYLAHTKTLPTAFVAINDEAAMGAMRAFREHGLRVPQDVSIIGFDDISLAAHTTPALTTIRIPRKEMGRLAAKILAGQLEVQDTPVTRLVLQTELVVRESCAPPRAG